jgi:hypothetical protein
MSEKKEKNKRKKEEEVERRSPRIERSIDLLSLSLAAVGRQKKHLGAPRSLLALALFFSSLSRHLRRDP